MENRQFVGFDASLYGHGLLIWHIAANVASFRPNDNHPLQVYPVCASSTTAIPTTIPDSYGRINSGGCPFPGTSNNTEFSSNSIPQFFTWAGLTGIDMSIANIVENTNQTVSFLLCITPIVDFSNQTVTSNQTVINCGNISVQNVTIQNNAKLTLEAPDYILISDGFDVKANGEFEASNGSSSNTYTIITNKVWKLIKYFEENVTTSQGPEYRLQFDADRNRFVIQSGVNKITGMYDLFKNSISFRGIITSRIDSTGLAFYELVVRHLAKINNYKVVNNQLQLLQDDVVAMEFGIVN